MGLLFDYSGRVIQACSGLRGLDQNTDRRGQGRKSFAARKSAPVGNCWGVGRQPAKAARRNISEVTQALLHQFPQSTFGDS